MFKFLKSDPVDSPLLRAAIAGLRAEASAEDALSASSRQRVLEAALSSGAPMHPLPSLFLPTRRILAAAALPIALAVAIAMEWREGTTPKTVRIEAVKRGDRVVFSIADGDRDHVVRRSTVAQGAARDVPVRVEDGSFTDAAHGGPDLVFYRID